MSGEIVESQGQMLSPRKWYPASAALIHRPVTLVDKAAQYVPLLGWQEDRQPPREPVAPLHESKAIPVPQATVDPRNLSTAATTSDASISSSDEEFDPSRKPRRRLAGGKQSQAKQEPSPDTVHKTAAAALPVLFRPRQRAAAGPNGTHEMSSSLQSGQYQANVNAFAQQVREQRLKLKQAAVKAETELDRLTGLLQREQALQASVNKGSIRLADNGARLAGRLAQLHGDISRQQELVQMFAEQKALDAAAQEQHQANGLSHGSEPSSPQTQNMILPSQPSSVPAHHAQQADQVTSSRQDQSGGRQSAAGAEGNADQRQDTKGRHVRPRSGRQSRRDAQPRDLSMRDRHDARQGHGDPNHSPRKGRQMNEQDTRPAKRQRQQGSSRSLQSQRQAWMHKLTTDAAQEAARLEAEAWAAEYQPSWTYQDNQGLSQGPFQLAELKAMAAQGSLQGSTMVHDEEAEISIRLDTLIANSERSRSTVGHLGSPEFLPNAAGDAAEGLNDSQQAADAGLTVGVQEAPPVCDDVVDSDTAEQSGEPVDTPVEPVWSPQYSPDRLASLIPEHQPPVSNPRSRTNVHDQSDVQDHHPQGSANTAGHQEPAVQHASSSEHWRLPSGHAEHDLQHAHASGRSASQQQQAVGPAPSGMLSSVAPWHPLPDPPLPSSGPQHGSHDVAMQHSSVLPSQSVAYAGSALPAAAQGLQGYQQHSQPLPSQHPAMHGLLNAVGPPGHEAPLGSANAPGSFQSEQQPNVSVYKRDGFSPLAQYAAHDNRPEGPVGSQHDAYNGHSEHNSGAVYDPYIPEAFHSNLSHSNGMQHVDSMQQLVAPQADSMHKQYQPSGGSQAGVVPIGHDQQALQQSMRGGLHQHHPTHFPAEHHSQHKNSHAMQDHMGPIKTEPGVSVLSFDHHGGIKVEGHTHGQGAALNISASQMPSGAHLSTILSPELSAALAAGVLGPSIAHSGQRPMADAQHQVEYQQMPQRSEHAFPVAALSPELSAALASGQLGVHLGTGLQPRHEPAFRTHQAHPAQSQSLAQQQNQDPELHRLLHPQYSQVPAAPMHHSVQPDTARQALSQLAMHHPSLHIGAAVPHSRLPAELYPSHQPSPQPVEPPAVPRPEPQLVDVPGHHQPHHQPQFDVSQPANYPQQQAAHHAHLSQGDAPYEHGQQMHSQQQRWLQGSQQGPYDTHMPGSGLTHQPQMQPAHRQHVSDDMAMRHAESGRHDHPQQVIQQPGPRPMAWADDRPVADPEYRPSHHMAGLSEGPSDQFYYEQGYGQEQQEDADPQQEGRGGYEPPLTAEEAEWEWQRQLAEQQDSQEEDAWYDDAGEHPPAYDDGYGLRLQSPSAHWEEEPPEGGWHEDPSKQPGPGSHLGDAAPMHHQPGRSQRQYIAPDGRPRKNRRGGRRHRRPPTQPYAG
ncbi:TPA: hypothetical protein ACH3X1_002007 [Trebouxia sp. C0004]